MLNILEHLVINKVHLSDRINCTTSKKSFDFTEKSEESGQVVVTVGGKNSSDDIQFTYKVIYVNKIPSGWRHIK